MKTLLIAISLASLASAGMLPAREKVNDLLETAFLRQCWGRENMKAFFQHTHAKIEECLQMEPLYTIQMLFPEVIRPPRTPANPVVIDPDRREKLEMFSEDFLKFKMDKVIDLITRGICQ